MIKPVVGLGYAFTDSSFAFTISFTLTLEISKQDEKLLFLYQALFF
ncbi:MAG: hypothetical protein IPG89_11035 [Bacteroidetes bacterium]|nr:hypothetical protein [Bacteroidota bacterium]